MLLDKLGNGKNITSQRSPPWQREDQKSQQKANNKYCHSQSPSIWCKECAWIFCTIWQQSQLVFCCHSKTINFCINQFFNFTKENNKWSEWNKSTMIKIILHHFCTFYLVWCHRLFHEEAKIQLIILSLSHVCIFPFNRQSKI